MRLTLPVLALALAAGPSLAQAQVMPAGPPQAPPVPLEVHSDTPGVTLHEILVEGPRGYYSGRYYDASRPLCTAPCQTALSPGTYRFALSADGDPVRANRLTSITGPSRLDLEYESRNGLRIGGWVGFALSGVLAAGAVVAGTLVWDDGQDDLGLGLMIGAIGVITVGGIIAIPLVAFQDHVEIRSTSITVRFN